MFRTYNASITLQEQLAELTDEDDNLAAKVLSYNRANRAVAVLCNHQRAVPKTHDKSMATLQAKIDLKKEAVEKAEKEFKKAKKDYKNGGKIIFRGLYFCASLILRSIICAFHYVCVPLCVHFIICALHYVCTPLCVAPFILMFPKFCA